MTDDEAEWDSSGWSPVFDAWNELAGFTRLQIPVGKFMMSRAVVPRWGAIDQPHGHDVGTMQLLGQAHRIVRERPDGTAYYAFRVHAGDGDPADLPDFFAI